MKLPNIFRRAQPERLEARATAAGWTAELMAARAEWISGRASAAELTATVQSCVSLWEGGFALGDVTGTELLDRRTMALIGRALALRGEAVFLIRDDRLVPFSDWDMRTRDGIPTAYRGQISEAAGGRAETALAAEVLHFRIASDVVTPWAGRSPLSRVPLSAGLLAEIEGALHEVYRDAPIGSQIIPLPEGSADDMAAMRSAFRGARGRSVVIEGVAQATAAGMNPNIGQKPDQLTPDLQKAMTAESLSAAQDAICSTYGVLPALMNRSATGPVVREAQRHLAQWVLQPLALLVAEEARRKLAAPVVIDIVRPAQAFDQGGKARAFATMVKALAEAKAAGLDMQAITDAESFIDWAD